MPADREGERPRRLAIVVSHPIQYYAPLYQRLASRAGVALRVFFTWHDGREAVLDRGFGAPFSWDIPLTSGYDHELVPNVSRAPGTHRFLGLRNPELLRRVVSWNPDAVHVTGWAWSSHLQLLRKLRQARIPSLFRGDSHLLDNDRRGLRWVIKRSILRRVFAWPQAFLAVGAANREYYAAFGVPASRIYPCPHSVDVTRFANNSEDREREAREWRHELELPEGAMVVLFAGKFERKKRPVELLRAFLEQAGEGQYLLMVGGGDLEDSLRAVAAATPGRVRFLPFQNQSRMPVVYRLGDLFILPSSHGETWGLAVNEALACGRAVAVSDRVGCASDVVDDSCGFVFPWQEPAVAIRRIGEISRDSAKLRKLGAGAISRAWRFDISVTEAATAGALNEVSAR